MKTKMKMKNNRMLLALVMVAALAMVSVAGVAVLSDDSSAAETQYVSGDGTISAVNGNDYFIDVNSVQKVIISDTPYSGTISVGVFEMNTDANGNVTYKVIGTISSVTLDGAKNAVVVIGSKTIPDVKGTLAVISAEPTNATVKVGTAVFASNDKAIAFSGTVKASGATITIANVNGLAVTAGSTANIFGVLETTVAKPVAGSLATTWGTVTISGTASINNELTVKDNVKLVIAEGADVTVGKIPALFNVSIDSSNFSTFVTAAQTATGNKTLDLNSDYKMVTLDGVVLTQIQIDDFINNTVPGKYSMSLPVGSHTVTVYYNGDMSGAKAYTLTVKITVSADTTTGKSVIAISDSAKTKTVTVDKILSTAVTEKTTLTVNTGGEMVVAGTLKTQHTSDAVCGSILNNGTIDITGMISCQNDMITGAGQTNAARYTVAPASGTAAPTTYNYTTLANAMKLSADITIIGKITIYSDTTLTGASSTAPIANKITVDGELVIGTADKTAIVTVPSTTTFTGAGTLTITNGQVKIEGLKTDMTPVTTNSAAVFMTSGAYGIYTDLATALGISVSGETVKLRNIGVIDSATEVKTGVVLDAAEYALTINAGGKLTINGKLINGGIITVNAKTDATTSAPAKAAGELVLNSNDALFTALANSGIVTVGTEAKLKMTDLTITVGTDAVFNINGEFDFSGSFDEILNTTGSAATFNITGKMTITVLTSTSAVDTTTFNVSGVLISNDNAMACEYLNVTGDGKVTVATGMTFIVNINMTIGTPSSGITASVNNATVKGVDLDTGASAVVYGTAANVDLKTYDATKTVFYFGDVVFATEYADGASVAMVMPTVKLKDFNFLGWYNAPVGGAAVTGNNAGNIGGDYKSVYGYTTPMQYSLTLTYNQGASWILNGTVHSGVVSLTAGTYDLSVLVNDGYKGDAKITVTGDATYSNGKLTVTGDAAVSVSGVSVKDGGLDITEILLIILVVIIALLAIIVVFKMLRS